MPDTRKVTVHLPAALLERAQQATGDGVTATIRRGLQILAAADAYATLLALKGKVHLNLDLDELREDRR